MHWLEPLEGKELAARRLTNRAIWGVVLAFVALATTYSVVTPLFEAPDELFHFALVRHLAEGGGLPVLDPANQGPWQQEGGQPPLYYALTALAVRWVPTDDLSEITRRNPYVDVGVMGVSSNPSMVIHTPKERWPYRGAVLAVHLARQASVLFGALAVFMTYALGLEVLPRRPLVALGAAALVAFNPMFLFMSGAVNNDGLVAALCTMGLWLLARSLRLPLEPGRWAVVGAVLGLAALAKVSALVLWPLALVVLAWVSWQRKERGAFVRSAASMLVVAGAIAGWWYCRNWRLYGDPLGLSAFLALVGPRTSPVTLPQLLSELPGLIRSYWGVFGWMNVSGPGWFYALYFGIVFAGLGGMLASAGRLIVRRRRPTKETLLRLGLAVAWPLLVGTSLVRYTLITMASHGRLLFPAVGVLALLMGLGLGSWLSGRWREAPVLLAVLVTAAVAVWAPFGVIRPAYARPPLLTPLEQAAIPERLDLLVGEGMELLGYE
ncbi:MAG: DUF2142 domain-containing protein, partial [Anaerolineae bacterium]|nr:DUF2142 domain-containing protein [Anaerolineae bacterium]